MEAVLWISGSNRKATSVSACVAVFWRGKKPGTSSEEIVQGVRICTRETGAQAGPRLPAHPRGNRERDAGAAAAAPPSPGPQRDPAVPVPPLLPPAGATRCCAAGRLLAPWTDVGTGGPHLKGSIARRCCRHPSSWFRPESVRRRFRVRAAATGAAAAATAGARTPTWVAAARTVGGEGKS